MSLQYQINFPEAGKHVKFNPVSYLRIRLYWSWFILMELPWESRTIWIWLIFGLLFTWVIDYHVSSSSISTVLSVSLSGGYAKKFFYPQWNRHQWDESRCSSGRSLYLHQQKADYHQDPSYGICRLGNLSQETGIRPIKTTFFWREHRWVDNLMAWSDDHDPRGKTSNKDLAKKEQIIQ